MEIVFNNGLTLYKERGILVIEYRGYHTSIPDGKGALYYFAPRFIRDAIEEVNVDITKTYTTNQLVQKRIAYHILKANEEEAEEDYQKELPTYTEFVNDTNETRGSTKTINRAHLLAGLVSEVGELAAPLQKVFRGHGVKDIDFEYMKLELGDILWYLTALCEEFDTSLEEIIELNMRKLNGRRETEHNV